MAVYVGYQSAVEFWSRVPNRTYVHETVSSDLSDAVVGLRAIADLAAVHAPIPVRNGEPPTARALVDSLFTSNGITMRPVHLMNARRSLARADESVAEHLCTAPLPDDSFVMVNPGLYVASPELCFLQMAHRMNIIDLIEFGHELCGSYAVSPTQGPTVYELLPLTTQAKLQTFVDAVRGSAGRKAALLALPHVHDDSASPKETELCMSLALPNRMAGNALRPSGLNRKFIVPSRLRHLTNCNHFKLDLCFEGRNGLVDVEYDSRDHHTSEADRAHDANRAAVLEAMGIEVISIPKNTLENQELFEQAVAKLRMSLGLRREQASPELLFRRQQLRNYLSMPRPDRPAELPF